MDKRFRPSVPVILAFAVEKASHGYLQEKGRTRQRVKFSSLRKMPKGRAIPKEQQEKIIIYQKQCAG
jgi:hypothetical protein